MISIYSNPISSIYNVYLQHKHIISAYMYTVGWDAGRISIYVTHNNKRLVLPHPLICIMLLPTREERMTCRSSGGI